jgi:acid phosphatase
MDGEDDSLPVDQIVSTNSTTECFKSAIPAGDMTPFNASLGVDLGAYGVNGYTTKKRDLIPSIQPELRHTTIGALARTVDEYDFVLHLGDFAYADDWYYNYNNTYTFADEPNVYESIIEVGST